MPYADRATDGTRLHYQVTGRRGGPPVLLIQGLGADKHGWDLQRLALAWRYRTIALDNRGAGRSDKPHGTYIARADGRRRDRRARRRRRRDGPRRRRVDGRGDQPDPRPHLPRAGALADAGVHVVPQPPVAARAARRAGAPRPASGAWASMTQRGRPLGDRPAVVPAAACRRSAGSARSPSGGPTHAFAAQVDAILAADETLAERLGAIEVPDARRRRQPGHPHAARRQRGARRADPDRRAGRHQRRRPRADDRARLDVQPRAARLPATGPSGRTNGASAEDNPAQPRRRQPANVHAVLVTAVDVPDLSESRCRLRRARRRHRPARVACHGVGACVAVRLVDDGRSGVLVLATSSRLRRRRGAGTATVGRDDGRGRW